MASLPTDFAIQCETAPSGQEFRVVHAKMKVNCTAGRVGKRWNFGRHVKVCIGLAPTCSVLAEVLKLCSG